MLACSLAYVSMGLWGPWAHPTLWFKSPSPAHHAEGTVGAARWAMRYEGRAMVHSGGGGWPQSVNYDSLVLGSFWEAAAGH